MKAKIVNSYSGDFNGKATLHYKNNILEIVPNYDSLNDKEDIILMCSGVFDKNNTEITEYDILKIGNNDNCLVVFKKGCFFVLIEDKAIPLYSIEECEVLYNQKQKEVKNCTKMKKQK